MSPPKTGPKTLYEKVWDRHVVVPETAETPGVMYVDLHLGRPGSSGKRRAPPPFPKASSPR